MLDPKLFIGFRKSLLLKANPPMLNPMVELVPAPWTDPSAVAEARTLMEQVGQVPIVLKKEIEGFVQARIQAAIFHVAWQLIAVSRVCEY